MALSEKPHDSGNHVRWMAWEKKNRRDDRNAERRMKLVFAAAGVILMILIAYALTHHSERPGPAEKGPIVASLETGRSEIE